MPDLNTNLLIDRKIDLYSKHLFIQNLNIKFNTHVLNTLYRLYILRLYIIEHLKHLIKRRILWWVSHHIHIKLIKLLHILRLLKIRL